MDPLQKSDSAISVASRDQLFYQRRKLTRDDDGGDDNDDDDSNNNNTNTTTTTSANASQAAGHRAPPPSSTFTFASTPLPAPQPYASSASPASPPAPAPSPAPAPAPAQARVGPSAAGTTSATEQLATQRHPPPLFVHRPDPSWSETLPRPQTPPKPAIDPAITTTTKTPAISIASLISAPDAAATNITTRDADLPPPASAAGPAADEDPAENEQILQQSHNDHAPDPDALTQAASGAIIVDQEQLDLESDPGYESDRASFASTSLSSSVRDYLYENGRRYHRFREGQYNFPNDEPEQDREDMKHHCVKLLCQNRLFFAPIEEGPLHNILDIGTGTGIWAIEMGDQFPAANVLGIDLSPIQPEWVPANVHFVVDDAESEWIYPDHHFDYIHTRHTVMAIKDWPKLYRTAQQYLRPGGWIESQEIWHFPISANNSMPPEHPIAQYWGLINEGLQRLGVDFHACAGGKIAKMMRDAGYVNVHERIFHVPIGTWAKHPNLKMVGEYWRHVLLEGIQAIALGPLTRGCGWTKDQVEVFLVDVRREYYNNSCLMYMPMYVTYGQRPED